MTKRSIKLWRSPKLISRCQERGQGVDVCWRCKQIHLDSTLYHIRLLGSTDGWVVECATDTNRDIWWRLCETRQFLRFMSNVSHVCRSRQLDINYVRFVLCSGNYYEAAFKGFLSSHQKTVPFMMTRYTATPLWTEELSRRVFLSSKSCKPVRFALLLIRY